MIDWTPPNPYDYVINSDNSFTILQDGKEIHTSRAFRLKVQAERKAVEYVQNILGQSPQGAITLDVQSYGIDPETLFRRL